MSFEGHMGNEIGEDRQGRQRLTVTGVVENIPHNSHIQFDLLIPLSLMRYNGMRYDSWIYNNTHTYLLLQKDVDLTELNPKGKAFVTKNKLDEKGFNFHYHTKIYKTKTGKVYYFCYEQGYLAVEGNKFSLVIKQDYVD